MRFWYIRTYPIREKRFFFLGGGGSVSRSLADAFAVCIHKNRKSRLSQK